MDEELFEKRGFCFIADKLPHRSNFPKSESGEASLVSARRATAVSFAVTNALKLAAAK